MTIELLIESIVRQTTVLIAQLATSGGARAPLAQVANQVFFDLASELSRQGVSRKVSADLFGLGLRTYQRKIQRLLRCTTERGRSLGEEVLDCVCRVREDSPAGNANEAAAGSTYKLDVWQGHPLEREARETLARLRTTLADLRHRVEAYNAKHEIPEPHDQIVLYVGQCTIPQGVDDSECLYSRSRASSHHPTPVPPTAIGPYLTDIGKPESLPMALRGRCCS